MSALSLYIDVFCPETALFLLKRISRELCFVEMSQVQRSPLMQTASQQEAEASNVQIIVCSSSSKLMNLLLS